MVDLKTSFNAFLESGDRQRELRSGATGTLLLALMGSSVAQLLISAVATFSSSAIPSSAPFLSLINVLCCLVISNAAFSFFSVVGETGSPRPVARCQGRRLLETLPLQIACAFIVSIFQVIASSLLVSLAQEMSVQMGMLCSVLISTVATLLAAGCVFGLVSSYSSEMRGLRGVLCCGRLLSLSFERLAAAVGDIARPLALFIIWNVLAGFAVPVTVAAFAGGTSGSVAISLASLIGAGLFPAAALYMGLMLVHFTVAGYLEIDVLIGIAVRIADVVLDDEHRPLK